MNQTNNLLNNQKYIIGEKEKRRVFKCIRVENQYSPMQKQFFSTSIIMGGGYLLFFGVIILSTKSTFTSSDFYWMFMIFAPFFVFPFFPYFARKRIYFEEYEIYKISFSHLFDVNNYVAIKK